MDDMMLDKLEAIYSRYEEQGGNTISLLQDIQEVFGFIPAEAIRWFSSRSGEPACRIFGVATFYSQFFLAPRGRNIVTACCGTACHVKGAERIISRVRDGLSLTEAEETTADGEYTLEKVACLGFCSFAPVVLINGEVLGRTTGDAVMKEIRKIGAP